MKQLLLLSILSMLSIAATSQSKNFIDQPYVEVSGIADTLVTPDEIDMRIIISEKDTRDKLSVEELEVKLLAALKELGIDTDKDLTISDMVSNFRYYLLKSKDVLKRKTFILRVRDAATAGKVIMKLEELEISNVSIDKVDYSDKDGLKNIMRAKAVEKARAQAEALAEPMSQSVGAAMYIGNVEMVQPAYDYLQSRNYNISEVVVTGFASKNKQQLDTAPLIEFQKIKISVNVNVMFMLNQ